MLRTPVYVITGEAYRFTTYLVPDAAPIVVHLRSADSSTVQIRQTSCPRVLPYAKHTPLRIAKSDSKLRSSCADQLQRTYVEGILRSNLEHLYCCEAPRIGVHDILHE